MLNMKIMTTLLLSFVLLFNVACNNQEVNDGAVEGGSSYAVVEKVSVSGSEGNYTFSVTLKSPDKGCDQYANWWEVMTENEELVYRRILGHSHVSEQPFTRSGGNVNINASDVVIVRGHMNTSGYGEGEIAMKGTVELGFESFVLSKDFAKSLESIAPQPTGCAF